MIFYLCEYLHLKKFANTRITCGLLLVHEYNIKYALLYTNKINKYTHITQ